MTLRALRLFYSYSPQDQLFRDKLDQQLQTLRRRELISQWDNRAIEAGQEWRVQIERNLDNADIILLFVSSAFFASDYHWNIEMKRALELHEQRKARVIPILLRPVAAWTSSPLAQLQCLPMDSRPISTWEDKDHAFVNVAEGILKVVESLRHQLAATADVPSDQPSAMQRGLIHLQEPVVPQTTSLRRFIEQVLIVESDFDAFCHEHFPEAHQRIGSGMDRKQKLTLLLQIVKRDGQELMLLDCLKHDFEKAYHRHEKLLSA